MKEKTKKVREEDLDSSSDSGEWKEEMRGNYSGRGRMIVILCAVLLVINLAQCVCAFGITPARTTIDFSSGLERSISLNVVNSEHKDLVLGIDKGGSLAEFISLNSSPMYISASEETKEIRFSIKLPSELSPGDHSSEIVIREIKNESQSQFSALIALSSQIIVKVPYPGKYLEAAVDIGNARAGENTTIKIPLVNRGYSDLNDVSADIDIYNKNGRFIMSVESNTIQMKAGERKEVIAVWESKVPAGEYVAFVEVKYDGQSIKIEKDFSLGLVEILIEEIEFGSFELGGIAKVDLHVTNQWDGIIKGVHSRIVLYDKFGKKAREFSSPDIDIGRGERAVLTSYLESSGMSAGNYSAEIYLENNKISSDSKHVFEIGESYIRISGSEEFSRERYQIIVLISVLIAVTFVIFLSLSKKKK